jgi:hypothetical protein
MATTNNTKTTNLCPPPTHIHKTHSSQSSKINLQQLLDENQSQLHRQVFFRKRSNSDPQEVTADLVREIKQKLARISTTPCAQDESGQNGVFLFLILSLFCFFEFKNVLH